jgi:hypothetical protein
LHSDVNTGQRSGDDTHGTGVDDADASSAHRSAIGSTGGRHAIAGGSLVMDADVA